MGKGGLRTILGRLLLWRRQRGQEARMRRLIRETGVFDEQAYLIGNPDVAAANVSPLRHFLRQGWKEGRDPNQWFDSQWYKRHYPDVAQSGQVALAHFLLQGAAEGRNPGPRFNSKAYRAQYMRDGDGGNPLAHWMRHGRGAGIVPPSVIDSRVRVLLGSGLFDADWYQQQYPDTPGFDEEACLHYLEHGVREGRNPSPWFDTLHYLRVNPDVAESGTNPLLHYHERGWRELRNPGPAFDVWWYWSTYLDPREEVIDPLEHFVRVGLSLGNRPRPERPLPRLSCSPPVPAARRLCLFAGYDPDGRLDDTAVAYIRELSHFADVHYWADCEMEPGELDKIDSYVKSAQAQRHGAYDFGSWRELIRTLGWERISAYDELLLVNDSCYLLRPLDELFKEMSRRDCHWWGLQATKGIAATRDALSNQFPTPISMETVRNWMLEKFEDDDPYDFLVGSYFLAFRRDVVADAGFRRLLESVCPQEYKKNIVLKYEVGLTRYLCASGYRMDTYIPHLYPFHPIYTHWYYELLRRGFPLIKRYLLVENHYAVPELWRWRDQVLASNPQADVAAIERHLARTVPEEKLRASLSLDQRDLQEHVPATPTDLLSHDEFITADQTSPTHSHWWAFMACAFSGVFSGNERAVFERVRNDPSIHKIIFTRGEPVDLQGESVEVVPLESPRGQHLLMRCGVVFFRHSPARNIVWPLDPGRHALINLWHGIPFKRIGYASLDMLGRLDAMAEQHAQCRAVICSSRVDQLAMTAAFHPLSSWQVWNTGLPRNDFIICPEERLPADMRDVGDRLRRELAGRRLILFMPTFRNGQEQDGYRFSADELQWLESWLIANNLMLGLREHMADLSGSYSQQLQSLPILDLSARRYPDPEILYRISAALITDYSSTFIDYMLTGKPAVSFAHDLDRYQQLERGTFYDIDHVFPGPVCRNFSQLRDALQRLFETPSEVEQAKRQWLLRLFLIGMMPIARCEL